VFSSDDAVSVALERSNSNSAWTHRAAITEPKY
jgi:hypothetical protein